MSEDYKVWRRPWRDIFDAAESRLRLVDIRGRPLFSTIDTEREMRRTLRDELALREKEFYWKRWTQEEAEDELIHLESDLEYAIAERKSEHMKEHLIETPEMFQTRIFFLKQAFLGNNLGEQIKRLESLDRLEQALLEKYPHMMMQVSRMVNTERLKIMQGD